MSQEAFITALSDGRLQLEVMKGKPPNVEATLSHSIKVEAFEQSLACEGSLVTDQDDGCAKCQSHVVCAVLDHSDSIETVALRKRVDELQEALEPATKGIAALAAGPWSGRTT